MNDDHTHQLIIYENSSDDNNSVDLKNSVFPKLLESFLSLLIDFSKMHVQSDAYFLDEIKPRYSTGLLIFFQHQVDATNAETSNFINFYEQQYPKKPCQKCLIVYLNVKPKPKSFFEIILHYDWQKKFLAYIKK